ncbi:MAG: SPOR domain-containing protein [Woeseiaceae bacterium]|nr:SPOR domain-containing protein [Woeseiaceae bacterium]
MAQRRTRQSSRANKQKEYPGWLWMIFGLAIGLSVAFAVYVKDREPAVTVAKMDAKPVSKESSLDVNNAATTKEAAAEDVPKERFNFYKILPAFEMVIANEGPNVDKDVEPQAVDEPGIYMLQAGSFSTYNDANRRIAELALHGIESRVQRARVNNRDYYRVYVGPIDDLDDLNITRSRLRAAKIDVMRIRLGD